MTTARPLPPRSDGAVRVPPPCASTDAGAVSPLQVGEPTVFISFLLLFIYFFSTGGRSSRPRDTEGWHHASRRPRTAGGHLPAASPRRQDTAPRRPLRAAAPPRHRAPPAPCPSASTLWAAARLGCGQRLRPRAARMRLPPRGACALRPEPRTPRQRRGGGSREEEGDAPGGRRRHIAELSAPAALGASSPAAPPAAPGRPRSGGRGLRGWAASALSPAEPAAPRPQTPPPAGGARPQVRRGGTGALRRR